MMSSRLMIDPLLHVVIRVPCILATILTLIVMSASAVNATVTKAESGDGIKPMSAAVYARIKAQIRSDQPLFHVTIQPKIVHWKANISSGWLMPWPR